MRNGILLGIFLLGIAATASALGEWYWIGCSQTYDMGDSGGMDLIPCAISQSTGGGGSKIITHDNYYCTQFTEWRTSGYFRVHAVLYNGTDGGCSDWRPGEYCYNNPDCDKYVDWGGEPITLAEESPSPGYYIMLDYGTSQWGPVAFAHGGSPLVNKMGFKIRVEATQHGKLGGGKRTVIKQATSSYISPASAPLTASAVKTATRKPRLR